MLRVLILKAKWERNTVFLVFLLYLQEYYLIYKQIQTYYIHSQNFILGVFALWMFIEIETSHRAFKIKSISQHLRDTSGALGSLRPSLPASFFTPHPRDLVSSCSSSSHGQSVPPSSVSPVFTFFTKALCPHYCHYPSSPNAETQRGWIIGQGIHS